MLRNFQDEQRSRDKISIGISHKVRATGNRYRLKLNSPHYFILNLQYLASSKFE